MTRGICMADENEHSRRIEYRKLRAQGMGDKEATERVWPSTSAGMKVNADEKAKAESDRLEKEGAEKPANGNKEKKD